MAKICGDNCIKIIVDYAAVSLLVIGFITLFVGIMLASFVPNSLGGHEDIIPGLAKIWSAGISEIAGGLLLLFGIIQGNKVFVLVYLIISTPGLGFGTVYHLYSTIKISTLSEGAIFNWLIVFIIFLYIFAWWVHYCIYLFYDELRKKSNATASVQNCVESGEFESVQRELVPSIYTLPPKY